MNTIFFNQTDSKLRSGWRAGLFLFSFLFAAGMAVLVEEMIVSVLPIEPAAANLVFMVINGFGLLTIALAFGGLAGKIIEDLPFRAIGVSFAHGWSKHLLIGIGIGALALCVAVLVTYVPGGESFELNPTDNANVVLASLATSFLVFAVGAAWEEAFFRGYLFQTFTRSGLTWFALAFTSIFFGVVHLSNANATVISTINTVLAGVMFGLAYLKTRDLWFVWGIHLMWNWTQGSIFGIEVSGLTNMSPAPLLKEIDAGPAWLTGTTYGIEGGIACTIAIIGTIILIQLLPGMTPPQPTETSL